MPIYRFKQESNFTAACNERRYSQEDFEETYTGCVLELREHNGYNESDFHALVWDDDAQCVRSIEYATTRFPCLDSAKVDATPEVIAKAQAWTYRTELEHLKEQAARDARRPDVGKRVRTLRGRKIPIGTEGVVTWVGVDTYKSTRWATFYRVRLELGAGECAFTALDNLEVIDPEEWLMPLEVLEARARRVSESSQWAHLFTPAGYDFMP